MGEVRFLGSPLAGWRLEAGQGRTVVQLLQSERRRLLLERRPFPRSGGRALARGGRGDGRQARRLLALLPGRRRHLIFLFLVLVLGLCMRRWRE